MVSLDDAIPAIAAGRDDRLTVTRTSDLGTSHTVNWAVIGSGASVTNGGDFGAGVLPSGTLTFAAAESSKTISLNTRACPTGVTQMGIVQPSTNIFTIQCIPLGYAATRLSRRECTGLGLKMHPIRE